MTNPFENIPETKEKPNPLAETSDFDPFQRNANDISNQFIPTQVPTTWYKFDGTEYDPFKGIKEAESNQQTNSTNPFIQVNQSFENEERKKFISEVVSRFQNEK
jgi:hypothetical protein